MSRACRRDAAVLEFLPEVTRQLAALSETEYFGEDKRLSRAVRAAWDEDLTEKQRLYLESCCADGLSLQKTAERFGVTDSTVFRTVQRGKKRLRRALRGFFPDV